MKSKITLFSLILTIVFTSVFIITNAQVKEQRDAAPAEPKYHPNATELRDSKSETFEVEITVQVDYFASEATWNVWNINEEEYYFAEDQTFENNDEENTELILLSSGSYEVRCWDSWGDGGIAGTVEFGEVALVEWGENDYGDHGSFGFSIYPGPYNLTATIFDENNIQLEWEIPVYADTLIPTGFKVFRNDEIIDTAINTSYQDENLSVGLYEYYITAFFTEAGIESVPSNLSTTNIQGEEVAIPDTNFRMVINEHLGYEYPETLNHSPTELEMTTIIELDGQGRNIEDITGGEYLIYIETLNLSNNSISDLDPLYELSSLKSLYLNNNTIADISALSGLLNLSNLELSNNSITDITPLLNLTDLTSLWLNSNFIFDISIISNLQNLTWLNLGENYIIVIDSLSGLVNIEILELWDNSISNIAPLSELVNLTRLFLNENSVVDISPLSGLTELEWLQIPGNSIEDITPLAGLTNLNSLSLKNNSIENIEALSVLTNLTNLGLDGNSITDISPLSELTSLTYLSLYNNSVVNIKPLAELENLEVINLNMNSVKDIGPVSNLNNINGLFLSSNSITDIYPLLFNIGLGNSEEDELNLLGNPLSMEALQEHIPVLEERTFNDLTYDSDYHPLAPCYPNPERNDSLYSIVDSLQWEANFNDDDVTYDLYMGQNPDSLVLQESGLANTAYAFSAEINSTYFWRVETINNEANYNYDTLSGGVWKFLTIEPPQITYDPESISEQLSWGKDTTFYLMITNNSSGIIPLNYSISFVGDSSSGSKPENLTREEWYQELQQKHQNLEKPERQKGEGSPNNKETIFRNNGGEFLVIDPDGEPNSGEIIEDLLIEMGKTVDYTNNFNEIDEYDYNAVFVTLGIWGGGTSYILQESDVAGLTNYLDNGGNLYMEGGDTWYFNSPTSLHSYFYIEPIADGASSGDLSIVNGIAGTFTEGVANSYSGHNSYIDHLAPLESSYTVFRNEEVGYGCGIAYDGEYKTIGTSFILGGLEDSPVNKTEILEGMLEFFDPMTQDWLTVSPYYGEIEAGNEQQIELRVDGTEFPGLGTFSKELNITTNDPENETLPFNISITTEDIFIPDTNFRMVINEHLGYEYPETLNHYPTDEEMASITEIQGNNRNISDLSGANWLSNIQYIQLNENSIQDIAPLEMCSTINQLSLKANDINDISPIQNLTNLMYLNLGENSIQEINVLQELNIQTLYLNGNDSIDYTTIKYLYDLKSLNLSSNGIKDISFLQNLDSLESLVLNMNSIIDILPISNLQNLDSLSIRDNQIFNINYLKEIYNLKQIILSGNNISDINALVENQGIGDDENDFLDLRDNPLSKEAYEEHIPILNARDFEGFEYDSTYSLMAPCYPVPNRYDTLQNNYNTFNWSANFDSLEMASYEFYWGESQENLKLIKSNLDSSSFLSGMTSFENNWWHVKTIYDGDTIHGGVWSVFCNDPTPQPWIPDTNFRMVINEHLGYEYPETVNHYPTDEQLTGITEINGDERNIESIEGAQYLININNLSLRYNSISDISPLAGLNNLTSINFGYNLIINDISPVSDLTNLTGLFLYGNSINDISPIASLTNLTHLNLWSNSITDISPVSGLANLRSLHLRFNLISDISPVSGLTNLRLFNIGYNSISDIYPLIENTSLGDSPIDDLYLKGNPLSKEAFEEHIPILEERTFDEFDYPDDFHPLAPCYPQPIRYDTLTDNTLSWSANYDSLENVTYDLYYGNSSDELVLYQQGLTETSSAIEPESDQEYYWRVEAIHNNDTLYGGKWQFSYEASGVFIPDTNFRIVINEHLGYEYPETLYHNPSEEEMAAITELDGEETNIESITGAEYLINIEDLSLPGNSINNISAISGLTSLQSLNLDYNSISDINALAGLTNLQILRLGRNSINDISAISGLISLQTLVLDNNSISDISPLSGLTSLESLYLSNNCISNISSLQGLLSLVFLDFYNNSINDISSLSDLTSLRVLLLSNNLISDIYPLVANNGIGYHSGIDWLEMFSNPISKEALEEHIPQLEERNLYYTYDNYYHPMAPCYPQPIRHDTLTDNTLSWSANYDSLENVTYDLYYGNSSDELTLYQQGLIETSSIIEPESGQEYYWRVEAIHENDTLYGGVWSFTNESGVIDHQTTYQTGWNMTSFAVEPEENNLQTILQPIIDNDELVKVIDEQGNIIEQMPWGWVNNIGAMSPSEGYYVKVTADNSITTTGAPVSLPYDIPLTGGWNMMGYPSMTPQDATGALAELMDNNLLIKVIDEQGNIIENMPWGWVNNIGSFQAGEGYYIKVTEDAMLTIEEPSTRQGPLPESYKAPLANHFTPVYRGNPYEPMQVVIDASSLNLKQGDELAIFSNGQCVGAAGYNPERAYQYLTASKDDSQTAEQDGYLEGTPVILKVYRKDDNNVFNVPYEAIEGSTGYEPLQTKIVKASTLTTDIDNEQAQSVILYQNKPNPLKDKTTISYYLPESGEVSLSIVNLHGQEQFKLVEQIQKPGLHQIELHGNNLSPGIYLYRLNYKSEKGKQQQLHKKMTIVR